MRQNTKTYDLPTIFRLFFFSLLGIGILSCDARRDNPSDPSSPFYVKPRTIIIHVLHQSPSAEPIANVVVREENLQFSGITDQNGTLSWEYPSADSLVLISEKKGFFSDTTVIYAPQKNTGITIHLDAMPQISALKFTSYFENKYDLASTSIYVQIHDEDGQEDIRHVLLSCPQFSFTDTLKAEIGEKYVGKARLDSISPHLRPAQLPELNFYLIVQDQENQQVKTGPLTIRRVITEDLQLQSPANGATLTDSVYFSWNPVQLDFHFTYNLSLLRQQDYQQIDYKNIAEDQDHFIVKNLDGGYYLWHLEIEDELGNICQSVVYLFNFSQ